MSKLRSLINNEVVKKSVYDKLAAKVKSNLSKTNNIDTSGFVLKTKYVTDKSDLEKKANDVDKKTPDISGIVQKIIMLKLLT